MMETEKMSEKNFLISVTYTCFIMVGLFMSSHWVYGQNSCAGACHIIEPYVKGFNERPLLVAVHADAGLSCIDCHEQTEETKAYEKKLYENGEYDDPIVMREYDSDFCFQCHDGYDVLAEKTAKYEEQWHRNPHKSHLEEPDCYECHRVHRPSNFACGSCHTAKWEERLPEGWIVEQ
jgi:hypothetical protein